MHYIDVLCVKFRSTAHHHNVLRSWTSWLLRFAMVLFPTHVRHEQGDVIQPIGPAACLPPFFCNGVELVHLEVGGSRQNCNPFIEKHPFECPVLPNSQVVSVRLTHGACATVFCARESFPHSHYHTSSFGGGWWSCSPRRRATALFAGEQFLDETLTVESWTSVSGTYQIPDSHVAQSGLPLSCWWRCVKCRRVQSQGSMWFTHYVVAMLCRYQRQPWQKYDTRLLHGRAESPCQGAASIIVYTRRRYPFRAMQGWDMQAQRVPV